jgi:hypothetical protein
MSIQRDYTPLEFIVPDFDLKIIAARDEEGLSEVEVDASDWAFVFVEGVEQCAETVVQKLDLTGVEGCQGPGTFRVECDAFYTLAF